MLSVDEAAELAKRKHKGQFDDAGINYLHHVNDVVERLIASPQFELFTEQQRDLALVAAHLHDVVQTTSTTLAELQAFDVTSELVDLLTVLTRKNFYFEPDEVYYRRVLQAGPVAVAVKLADLASVSNPHRLAALPRKDADRITDTYTGALALLTDAVAA